MYIIVHEYRTFLHFATDLYSFVCETKEYKSVTYSYNQVNQLVKVTIQKGNAVTTETYEYDYAGNRISKQVNEDEKTYYVIDESSGLAQVVAEVEITKDASNKETKNLIATYTLNGDERISVEQDNKTSYYLNP